MAYSFGIKISKAGSDVTTAAESYLQLTSQYPVLKAFAYGEVTTVAGTWYTITHNLNYAPAFLCWGKAASGSNRFAFPRRTVGADPVGGQQWLVAYATTTTLMINTAAASSVYYYIFADTQP